MDILYRAGTHRKIFTKTNANPGSFTQKLYKRLRALPTHTHTLSLGHAQVKVNSNLLGYLEQKVTGQKNKLKLY